MFEIVFVVIVVALVTFFSARSLFRAVSGKKSAPCCGECQSCTCVNENKKEE